jgi:large subunit ribosomal protein L18
MRNEIVKKHILQNRRQQRVRSKMHGTAVKPRLCVKKSNKHILAQLIDDDTHHTLASVSTYSKQFRDTKFSKKNKESGRELGKVMGEMAIGQNIKEIIFDRGSHKYHGVLAEFANAAREAGLKF